MAVQLPGWITEFRQKEVVQKWTIKNFKDLPIGLTVRSPNINLPIVRQTCRTDCHGNSWRDTSDEKWYLELDIGQAEPMPHRRLPFEQHFWKVHLRPPYNPENMEPYRTCGVLVRNMYFEIATGKKDCFRLMTAQGKGEPYSFSFGLSGNEAENVVDLRIVATILLFDDQSTHERA